MPWKPDTTDRLCGLWCGWGPGHLGLTSGPQPGPVRVLGLKVWNTYLLHTKGHACLAFSFSLPCWAYGLRDEPGLDLRSPCSRLNLDTAWPSPLGVCLPLCKMGAWLCVHTIPGPLEFLRAEQPSHLLTFGLLHSSKRLKSQKAARLAPTQPG